MKKMKRNQMNCQVSMEELNIRGRKHLMSRQSRAWSISLVQACENCFFTFLSLCWPHLQNARTNKGIYLFLIFLIAYKKAYGTDKVWMRYRRNYRGNIMPKPRYSCKVSITPLQMARILQTFKVNIMPLQYCIEHLLKIMKIKKSTFVKNRFKQQNMCIDACIYQMTRHSGL